MSEEKRQKAIQLRQEGCTYLEISERLGGIPKTTLSYWLSKLALNNSVEELLSGKKKKALVDLQKKGVETPRIKRTEHLQSIEDKQKEAVVFIQQIPVKKIALAMLYLGEGRKQGGTLCFGNSSPQIIVTFLGLLRGSYVIDEFKFRITVQCRADQNTAELERFWSEQTGIPHSQFYGSRIDPRTEGKPSKKKEYKGVCRIDYFSADVFNELTIIAKLISQSLLKGP